MRKFLSLFLVAVLVLSSLCLPAVADGTNTPDPNPNPYGFGAVPEGYKPEGTGISSLAEITDKTATGIYYLTQDITIPEGGSAWIGDFAGVLDGNGHKITFEGTREVTTSASILFNTLTGTVKNLVIDGAAIKVTALTGGTNVALFGRTAATGARVENVALINAYVEQAANNARSGALDDKGNEKKDGAADQTINLGGLFVQITGDLVATDVSIHIEMKFTGKMKNTSPVGAFAGLVRTNELDYTLTNCHVVEGSKLTGFYGVGGFIGANGADKTELKHNGSFVNCTNGATIDGGSNGAKYNAGFVRLWQSGDLEFINCANNGKIVKGTCVGGYVGEITNIATKITFVNCANNADINITGQAGGGFLGRVSTALNATFTNCVNTGNITGAAATGGFVGSTGKAVNFTYTNCINTGNVSAKTGNAAGFHGAQSSTTATFKFDGCVNAGNISAITSRAGGIVGQVYANSTITIQNCINFGAISNNATKDTVEADLTTTQVFDAAAIVAAAQIGEDEEGNPKAVSIIKNNYNFGLVTGWDYEKTEDGVTATQTKNYQLIVEEWVTNPTEFENNVAVPETSTTELALDSALLNVLSGATVRVNKYDLQDNGIRYYIQTNKALLDKLAETYTISLGSNFALADTLGEAESFMGLTGKVSTVKEALADVAFKADGTYAAALNHFAEAQYATKFVAGGFITLTVGNNTYTIYTEAGDARSMAYVANETLKKDTAGKYNDYKTILETFAAALPAEN